MRTKKATPERAIKWLKNTTMKEHPAVKMAVEALEYRKPKEPDIKHGAMGMIYPICPTCGETITDEDYCPTCGQAIDWTKIEEE